MLEAIEVCERVAGRELSWEMGEEPRIGDHRWWISDLAPFEADYPDWELRYGIEDILSEMYEQNLERWTATPGMKLSVVMPAQNEEGSVGATVEGVVAALEREDDRLRGGRRQRRQRGLDRSGGRRDRRRATRACAATAPTTNAASGWRSGPASTSSRATPWRS